MKQSEFTKAKYLAMHAYLKMITNKVNSVKLLATAKKH